MSIPPPPGYGICSLTFQRAGTPHLMAITMGIRNPSAATAAAVNTAWRAATLNTNTRPFHPANMLVGWTITQSYVLLTSVGGVPSSDVNTTPVVGIRAGSGMPVNTSVVVNKTVAIVGRQYRGRMLWPPTYVDKTNVDADGIILASQVTLLQTFATNMFAGMAQPAYLLHQPPQGGGSTPAPTIVNGLVVRARIGTIRHRIRR